ncbi:MAG: xanthine dehydrogenase family protein subunit M, partial [Rhodospirillaceae bacterium]
MYAFEYKKAFSLEDAKSAFDSADDATFMAGGMTLIPTLKQRLAMPSDVIDLGGIENLRGISVDGDTVSIGAMTCHADVAASAEVQNAIPALAYLASLIGDPQVRNRGTIGGSIANNDPAADYPGALVGLGATVHTTTREISADDFFTGMFETALEDGELVTKVTFPVPEVASYRKFPNPA